MAATPHGTAVPPPPPSSSAPRPVPPPPLGDGGTADLPPASRVAVDSAPVVAESDEAAGQPAAFAVAEQLVRDRPAIALAAAAGAGLIAGWLIKR